MIIALLVFTSLGWAAADSPARDVGASAFRPRFHVVEHNIDGVVASDRYAFFTRAIYREDPAAGKPELAKQVGLLLDERTGRTRALVPPACPDSWSTEMFGGPWLLIDCEPSGNGTPQPDLYNLATQRWVRVPTDSSGTMCGTYAGNFGACVIVGVGRYWVQLLATDCGGCVATYLLVDVKTGRARVAPVSPDGRLAFDLNSGSGVSRLCAPLRYPRTWNAKFKRWQLGWVSFYGNVALVAASAPTFGNPSFAYLQRCGSRRRVPVPLAAPIDLDGLSGSSREVVWDGQANLGTTYQLTGVLLPSLRGFTVDLPALPSPVFTALTRDHLYAYSPSDYGESDLYATAAQ